MNKPLTWKDFALALLGVFITTMTVVWNVSSRMSSFNIRIEVVESRVNTMDAERKIESEKTQAKLDKIQTNLTDISIMLQNKQDRQK